MKNSLVMKALTYEPDTLSETVMYDLVNNFFHNENDQNFDKDRLASLKSPINMPSPNTTGVMSPLEYEGCRAAYRLGLRSKEKNTNRKNRWKTGWVYLQLWRWNCGLSTWMEQ